MEGRPWRRTSYYCIARCASCGPQRVRVVSPGSHSLAWDYAPNSLCLSSLPCDHRGWQQRRNEVDMTTVRG
jgi:hypothetical protein